MLTETLIIMKISFDKVYYDLLSLGFVAYGKKIPLSISFQISQWHFISPGYYKHLKDNKYNSLSMTFIS